MSQPTTRGISRKIAGNSIAVAREIQRLERQQKLLGAVYVRRPGDRVTVVYAEIGDASA